MEQSFQVKAFIKAEADMRAAELEMASLYGGSGVKKEVIYLDNGYGPDYGQNYFEINYPFRAVFVRDATDSSTSVELISNGDSGNAIELFLNDSRKLPRLALKGAIKAAPQPGKSVTVYFITDGEFQPGSQLSLSAGGVAVTTGTGMTPQPCVGVDNTKAWQLVASDTTRKKATFQNRGGGSIFISGTSTVKNANGATTGTTIGIEVGPGQSFEWTNTGACYAIGDSTNQYLVSIQTET